MDYDDNDFQNQNLHLAGEGNAKFPPLRPYALPKFDFDESLQANLRFDSLVETEVFLGIESNEDNQWIDAFSRGGSGIEFSSSAAESCPISRHGNVWSEATSSESVEMLLKSVGQEDYIPRQTVIQESDACDELACLAKQMDTNSKLDDKNEFKDNVSDLHPPDGGTKASFSGSKENVGMEESLDGISQGHERVSCIDGTPGNAKLSDICRNIDLPVSEGNLTLYMDDKSNNTNQREVETVADDSHDDSPAVQTNIAESSMQNMGDEKQGPLQAQTSSQDLESSILNKEAVVESHTLEGDAVGGDAHHLDKPLCSIPTEETLEGGGVVEGLETGLSSLEGSGIESIAVSDLQKAEKSSEDAHFSDLPRNSACEDVMLRKDVVMDDHSVPNTCELPKFSNKEDSISEGQVVEVNNSSGKICPNLQQNVDVTEKIICGGSSVNKEDEILNTGDHVDTVILSSKSEASMFTAEENIISTISEGDSDNRVSVFSSSCVTTFSTKSSISGESTQTFVNNESDGQNDHEKCNQVVSVNDQESKRIPSDSSQMHADQSHPVDKGVVSSSFSKSSMETELTTSTVSIDAMPVNNSVSQVGSGNISLTSHEIIDIPPSSKAVSTHEVTSHNDFQGTTPVGSSSAKDKEESTGKEAEEASTTTLVGSSEQETAPCPVMGTENHHSSETSRQLLHDTDCQYNVGTSGAVKIAEPQGTTNDEVILECAQETGIPQILCASSEKQSDGVTESSMKDDKETVQENPDNSSAEKLGNNLLGNQVSICSASVPDSSIELRETGSGTFPANSTSPSTFRSPSQTEKVKNQVKASANLNTEVSDVINGGAKNALCTARDAKENDASKDERNSTPEVNAVIDMSGKDVADVNTEDVGKVQSVPVTETVKTSSAIDGSPSTSGPGPSKTKSVGNISHGNSEKSDVELAQSASKATPARKTRRASNKTVGKESSRRGSHAKDTTPARQSNRGGKSNKVSPSPSPGFQMMQLNEVQQYGSIDSNITKTFALANISTSSLPDLNSSASASVLFHQPFTDLQQVQLRAQIFVYGALIQGTVPDEAYMISAFGGSDGGRSIWENAWRAFVERQHGQKSHPANPETPLQSRSVARTSDLPPKQSSVQGKGISSPAGRTSSKATPPIVNPLIPLSSPLWSLSTIGLGSDSLQSSALARGSVVDYPQAITPMHPYETTPVRNFLGHNTQWISQTPLRGPWIASPTPVPDNSTHASASPASDTTKLGSIKGSLPSSSGIKNVTSGLPTSIAGLQSIFPGTASLLDANNVIVSPAQHSSDPKPKKRKKVAVSEDVGQRALQSLSPAVGSHTSTSVAVVAPVGNVPLPTVKKSIVSVSPLADQSKNDQNVEKRIMSDESLMKVKEARIHAEEASALSAAAVNHSLELWNQLDKHKNSGLMPDIEAKLASAAVAAAAAATIAKAAAAAANVASNAALQAKLMADEALLSSGYDNPNQSNQISLSEGINNLGKATPASILKGANGTNSPGSIIVAAKEAVKRRVEAASAASKRAENMDAIVRAAELAAEAVSQAGKIVTMGDPLPLSHLVEAGPEGCLKSTRESSQQVGLFKDITRDVVNVEHVRDITETSYIHNRDILSGGVSTSIKINEKNSKGPKGRKVSDLVKPVEIVPVSEPEIQAPSLTVSNGSENLDESNIKEGLLVEVFKDEEGFKAAWFTANILSFKDDKVHVCYTSLVAAEGAGPLKEWVSLEREGDKPPRIRTARPLTTLQYEGTRKRRRAAMGDYSWSVGDRVDALIQESWREGVITEKNKKDETTFTIHFPASGETLVVRAWHLRPSLIWKDGKWIESSKVGANDGSTHEGDTPHEKRPKLGSHAVEVKGKDKMSKGIDAVESAKPEEMKSLSLTENEKVFNIGKSAKNENKVEAHRMVRTGLQKEGSKVIFGVPKPGKKRKFMEVSKHYVAHESSKNNDRNDSVKLSNFLMPQSSGPRGWKNSSRNDAKEKHGADSKPKTSHTERIKDSSNHLKNASQSENKVERAPHSGVDGATGPMLFSSLATSVEAHPTKKASTSRASKGKLAPARDKSGKSEMGKALNDNPTKSSSDAIEPRRSNRRIQPTSRLLEGLQSSLIISKIPSVSHNRNTKG